jgi:hypothetical protein
MPSIHEVASNKGEYKFRPEVVELANELLKAESALGQISERLAGLVFRNQTIQGIPAETVIAVLTPLAQFQDEVDRINQGIVDAVAARREAYLNPPPSSAVEATITAKIETK